MDWAEFTWSSMREFCQEIPKYGMNEIKKETKNKIKKLMKNQICM